MAAMRRLAQPFWMLCSAVSLVLCVAVCVLWVRSGSRDQGDRVGWIVERRGAFLRNLNLISRHGSIRFVKSTINLATWFALQTIRNGEIVSADAF